MLLSTYAPGTTQNTQTHKRKAQFKKVDGSAGTGKRRTSSPEGWTSRFAGEQRFYSIHGREDARHPLA